MSSMIVIDDTLPYTQSIATSGQTQFDTNWTVDATTDVVVYDRDPADDPDDQTQVVSPNDYVVTQVGVDEFVRVTFLSGRTLNHIITITRQTPFDRDDLYTNTNFTPSMLNGDFGRVTLMLQQLQLLSQNLTPHYNYDATVQQVVDTILPILPASHTWVKNSADDAIITAEFPEDGAASKIDTYVTMTDERANEPNSFPLSLIAQGIMVNLPGTTDIVTRVLTGTANQIGITDGNGETGNPTFYIVSNPVIPGTAGMGIPQGTTAQRVIPLSGIGLRYNTDLVSIEYWDGLAWVQLDDADLSLYLLLAGGTMTGDIDMGGNKVTNADDPTDPQDYATKAYVDGGGGGGPPFLPLAGGTMAGNIDMDSNFIENVPLPVNSGDAVNKAYVDGIVFNVLPAADYATTANQNATYANGSSGVGATLTNAGVQVALEVDGIAVSVNDRILVWQQTDAFENGIYTVTDIGSGATNWVLTRATDYDKSNQMDAGDTITVIFGDTLAGHRFMMTQTTAITIGTTDITWRDDTVQFGVVSVTGTANEIDVDNTDPQNPVLSLSSTLVAPGTVTVGNIFLTGDAIQHLADLNNQIVFGTDTQSFETGGASRLDISDTGVRLGAANSRVTTILDEDNMSSNSNTALATQQSIKAYVDSLTGTKNTMPYGYIEGYTMQPDAGDPSHDIHVQTGAARDVTDTYGIRGGAITKQIDANWVAGNNQGGFPSALTLSANTWYHMFVIFNPTTGLVDAGFDTSTSATNLIADATGYTAYRRIGSVLTDGSSNIIPYRQVGDMFLWVTPPADINGSITTTLANYTLSVPPDFVCRAIINFLTSLAANNPSPYIHSAYVADQAVSTSIGTSPQCTFRHTTSSTTMGYGTMEVLTNTSRQIQAISNVAASNFGVITLGWRDYRNSDNGPPAP